MQFCSSAGTADRNDTNTIDNEKQQWEGDKWQQQRVTPGDIVDNRRWKFVSKATNEATAFVRA